MIISAEDQNDSPRPRGTSPQTSNIEAQKKTTSRMPSLKTVGLVVGRGAFGLGLFLLPILLLSMLFVVTTVLFVSPTLIAVGVIAIGCIPDAIVKYQDRRSTELVKQSSRFVVVDDASHGSHISSDHEQNGRIGGPKRTRVVQCVVAYMTFVVSLGIAAMVMLYRYHIWSYDDASLTILYLPDSQVQGSSMGVHVRVPESDGDALFRISYWPTTNPDAQTTTEEVQLNSTLGGTGDVVLTDLNSDVEYSYQVAVQRAGDGLFAERSGLAGTFRALPAPTDDKLTFASTSCIMVQMSLGRQASIFSKVSSLRACVC
jgi:hypothetical protein